MELGPGKNLQKKILENRQKNTERFSGKDLTDLFERSWIEKKTLTKLLQKTGYAVLGSGAECVVVSEGNEKILAVRYNYFLDSIGAKKDFYVQKILHTLFPFNFPRVYASFTKGEDSMSAVSGTIRQKIESREREKEKTLLQEIYSIIGTVILKHAYPAEYEKREDERLKEESEIYKDKNRKIHTGFSEVKKSLEETGMRFHFDSNRDNFIVDDTGHIYYVDGVGEFELDSTKKDQLIKYMNSREFSDSDKRIVSAAFDRIIALESEQAKTQVTIARESKRDFNIL